MAVAKVLFYPGTSSRYAPGGALGPQTTFVGILGVAHEGGLLFHSSLDAETQLGLLHAAAQGAGAFVMQVRPSGHRLELHDFLKQHGVGYRLMRGSLAPRGWLDRLSAPGAAVEEPQAIFSIESPEVLRWMLGRYGSLNQMRAFAVEGGGAERLETLVGASPCSLPVSRLLEHSAFLVLFDDDWEYIFLVTRRLSATTLVSRLRSACQALGLPAETMVDREDQANVYARIERLVALPLDEAPSALGTARSG